MKGDKIQKHSYGLLLFTGAEDDRRYLLVQNRDSEAFIYFFLAWNMEKWNENYLLRVVRGFSRDELNRLMNYPFDVIYSDLYVNHVKGTFQRQCNRARANYNYFHSREDWVRLCQNAATTEIKWGFCKGRVENGEHPHTCAFRELKEEVGISADGIIVRNDTDPIQYKNEKPLFRTSVNVCLFPAECPEPIPIAYQKFQDTIRCVSVSNEILHAKWASISDAALMIPHHLFRLLYEFHINTI